jgi:CBS-domain-containing membrane protein
MAPTRVDEAAGLTVADVMHSRFSALPASARVGEAQEWFAESTSHRLALIADDGRYLGRLVPDDVAEADPAQPAVALARRGSTVTPDEPATRGERLALESGIRRVPVVDHDDRLLGIVAITTDLQGFCGTGG